jgi:hypothetical protein
MIVNPERKRLLENLLNKLLSADFDASEEFRKLTGEENAGPMSGGFSSDEWSFPHESG